MSRLHLHAFLVTMASATLALAHPGEVPHTDLVTGFAHPFAGLDHALAALAVGLWAAAQRGRLRWQAPLLFLALLGVGMALGQRFGVPATLESGLAASVLVLGVLVVAYARINPALVLVLVGVFALVHGVAHGSEAPLTSLGTLLPYAFGLVLGTAALHALGYVGGETLRRLAPVLARAAGAAVALTGAWLLFT